MTFSNKDIKVFIQFERSGWELVANTYHDHWGVPSRVVAPLFVMVRAIAERLVFRLATTTKNVFLFAGICTVEIGSQRDVLNHVWSVFDNCDRYICQIPNGLGPYHQLKELMRQRDRFACEYSPISHHL